MHDRAGRLGGLALTGVLFALPALAPGMAWAVLTPGLEALGWRELSLPAKAENHFSLGQGGVIEVVSKDSASTLYKSVDVDLAKRPILKWRWRVDQAPPATDLSARGKDDCAIAVYVGFPYHSGQASFFERLKRPVIEAWAGDNVPGRVLRYVFCGRRPSGTRFASPYLGASDMVEILRPASSPTGEWFEQQVDVAADYRKAFGDQPENPIQVGIEADTDNTHSASRAEIADLAFVPRSALASDGQDSPGSSAPASAPPSAHENPPSQK
jgi:hypothetical protein